MSDKEILKADAETYLSIWTSCPYCNCYQNRFDDLVGHLDNNELRSEECEVHLRCERCNEVFIVDKINY